MCTCVVLLSLSAASLLLAKVLNSTLTMLIIKHKQNKKSVLKGDSQYYFMPLGGKNREA